MIFFYQRMLPLYRVDVFRQLNNKLAGELVVIHGQPYLGSCHPTELKNEEQEFFVCRVKNIWVQGERLVYTPILKPFFKFGRPRAVIIEQNPRILSAYLLWMLCRIIRIPIVLHGHGGSRRRELGEKNIKNWIHRRWIRACDAYICYTDSIKKSLSQYKDSESIFVANNTLNTEKMVEIRKKLEKRGHENIKKELSLKSRYYLAFIGRLIPEKRVEFLLQVLQKLQTEGTDVGAVIIGDGKELSRLKELTAKLKIRDVIFTGSISDPHRSSPFLFCADVLVNPGYVGLSVNQAFSFGLPVITTKPGPNGPFHSPEVDFVHCGVTGFMVEYKLDTYCRMICGILENREEFYKNVTTFAEKELTMESMSEGFVQAIEHVSKNKR